MQYPGWEALQALAPGSLKGCQKKKKKRKENKMRGNGGGGEGDQKKRKDRKLIKLMRGAPFRGGSKVDVGGAQVPPPSFLQR